MNSSNDQTLNHLEKSLTPMNSNDHIQSKLHPRNRLMEIDSSTDLSLFRSHSMPIPAFSGDVESYHNTLPRTAEDPNPDEDYDDDDDDELLVTPSFISSSINHHTSSHQRLFSCSLPPSLDRRKTNSNHTQHENPLDEFFQLVQPMREGVISREKLLPSSRMKQVGIGGRGRRALSNHKMNQILFSPTSDIMKTENEIKNLTSPIKYDQNLYSPSSSSFTYQQQSMNNNNLNSSIGSSSSMIINNQFAEVPLIRPRPILAWDHSPRTSHKKEITSIPNTTTESNYQMIK